MTPEQRQKIIDKGKLLAGTISEAAYFIAGAEYYDKLIREADDEKFKALSKRIEDLLEYEKNLTNESEST